MVQIFLFLIVCSHQVMTSLQEDMFFSNFIHRDFRESVTQIKDSYIFRSNQKIIYTASTNFVVINRQTQEIISRTNTSSITHTITGIEVSKDEKFAFFSCSSENLEAPVIESSIYPSHSVNDLKLDESKQRIVAVGSGFLSVIDYSSTKNLSVQGKLNLKAARQDHMDLSIDGKFAFVTLYDRGYGIYNVEQLVAGDETGAYVYAGKVAQFSHDIAISSDSKQLFLVDSYEGLFYIDISKILTQDTLIDTDIIKYPLDDKVMNFVYGIVLSPDNRYIFYGLQGRGIYVYDIQNPKSKVILQSLSCRVLPWELDISSDGKYLLVSGMTNLLVFQANPLHLLNEYMNFFNDLSSFRIDLPILNGRMDNPNRVAISPDQKIVIACYNTMGSYIIDIQNPLRPKMASFIPGYDSHDGVTFLQSKNVVLLSQSQSLMIYDVNDPYNIILKSDFKARLLATDKIDTDDVVFTKDQQYMVLANGTPGMGVVNIEDLSNPIVTGWWYLLQPGGSTEKCDISPDGNRVYMVSRGQGFFIIDITDKNNKNMTTLGWANVPFAYFPVINSEETLLFLAEQLEGVSIWNITDKANPIFIKRLKMDLMVAKMIMVQYSNSQYLLSPGWFRSTLNIVNITDSDPMNHYVILKYGEKNEDAPDVKITNDFKYAVAAVSNKGFRIWPIYPIVQMTSEIVMIKENELHQIIEINMDPTAPLEVGINYHIYLNYYSVKSEAKIVDVQLYNDQFALSPLPSWIKYLSESNQLVIHVNQEVVDERRLYSYLTLLLTVKTKLTRLSFMDDDFGISYDQSEDILKSLRAYSFVDYQDYLSVLTDPDGYIPEFAPTTHVPDYTNTKIQTKIREVLKYSQTRIPVIFWVVNSLKFNISSSDNLISSPSQSASIKVEFANANQIIFVKRKISGVTIIFDDDFSQFIEVIGDLTVLQGMFKNQINYYLKIDKTTGVSQDKQKIYLSIVVDDYSNERIIMPNVSLSDCIFLNEIPQLSVTVPITDQFGQFFPDYEVYMNQDFSFHFSESTFLTLEGLPIEYRGFYKEPDSSDWIEFGTTKFWLSFNNKDRNIFGKPPQDSFGDTFKVKIIASDTYFQEEEEFEFSVLKIVFADLIVFLAMGFSGLTALYSLIRYRYLFYNFACKRMFTTENLEAFTGERFSVCIPLIKDDLKIASSIFKEILKFPASSVQSMLRDDGDLNDRAIIQLINATNQKRNMFELGLQGELKDAGNQKTQIQKAESQEQTKHRRELFDFPDKDVANVQIQIPSSPNENEENREKINFKKQDGDMTGIRQRKSTFGQKKELTIEEALRRETLITLKKQKGQMSPQMEEQLIQLLDETNQPVYTPIVQQILFHVIALWAQKQLVNVETNQIFKIFKTKCRKERKFPNAKNWICQFCTFDYSHYNSQKLHQISYIPIIQVDEEQVKQQFGELQIAVDQVNMSLFFKIIEAQALGVSKKTRFEIKSSKGISICISQNNLQDVQAYQKINHSLLMASLGLDLKEISMGQLPPWLQCEIQAKTFHLFGKPEKIDQGSVLIKMINRSQITIRAFVIDVRVNQNQEKSTQLNEKEFEENTSLPEVPVEQFLSPTSEPYNAIYRNLKEKQ